MSFNTFGKFFRFTTWGESHGPAIGCVVDGCPPNIKLNIKDIQLELNKNSRNWEGLVRMDKKGFLMIVDEHPRTILAFVKKP